MRRGAARDRNERYDVVFVARWAAPLLAPGPGLATGGAETQMLILSRALAERGLRVGMIVVEDERLLPRRAGGVEIISHPAWRGGRRLVPGLAFAGYAWSWARTVVRVRPRALVVRSAGAESGMVAVIGRVTGARVVYSSANVVDFDFARLEPRASQVRLFHTGVRLASAIVVQTDEQAALCRARFRRDPVTIRSVAEPAEPRSGDPDAFLWIARTSRYKNPLVYVDLARAVPEALFRMVAVPDADGMQLDDLRRAVEGVPNLELLGPRPRSELGPLLERAVAIVNTSDYEGMPNVFLEGWSRGVPALALAHDPDGTIKREGVGKFAAGSPERLAELARELWQGRYDQTDLAARCRAYVQREHALARVVDAWVGVLGSDLDE